MWLYFDKNGRLLESLVHGNRARSGTTNFKIFAFFEDVDLSLYNLATLKLRKPDLERIEYLPLPMGNGPVTRKFILGEGENSLFFKNGEDYYGYEFDFDNFNDEEDVTILLDTPGLWEGIITLISSTRVFNVQGLATFFVELGAYYENGTQIGEDMIVQQLYTLIAQKMNAIDGILRVDPDLDPINLEGHTLGQVFYLINENRSVNRLVQLIETEVNGVATRSLSLLFDFTAYYTITEIDEKLGELRDAIAGKSSVSGTTDSQGNWKTLTIDGATHDIGGTGGGGGTANVEANPTVPSGVEQEPLIGLKVDDRYYKLDGRLSVADYEIIDE